MSINVNSMNYNMFLQMEGIGTGLVISKTELQTGKNLKFREISNEGNLCISSDVWLAHNL